MSPSCEVGMGYKVAVVLLVGDQNLRGRGWAFGLHEKLLRYLLPSTWSI